VNGFATPTRPSGLRARYLGEQRDRLEDTSGSTVAWSSTAPFIKRTGKTFNVQIFESCCYGNLSFVVNGPNYRVRALTEFIGA